MDGDTSAIKKNTIEIQWQIRADGKHQVWKAKGGAMDTNTGESPGHQSQSQQLGTHLVRKRWGIGLLRALSQWIMMIYIYIYTYIYIYVLFVHICTYMCYFRCA